MGLIRKVLPISRVAITMWAWRHRHEIGGWLGYAARSAPKVVAGDTADVLLEGRVRARLTADRRTRNLDGARIEVNDGVVTLRGMVPAEAHDAAVAIATNTGGARSVLDEMTEPRARSLPG
ncbi:MAG: BON domain-containing protein [Acidobacteria bacterium]|nr:BON domain-containing protein [Acidobacteriota bacterium]